MLENGASQSNHDIIFLEAKVLEINVLEINVLEERQLRFLGILAVLLSAVFLATTGLRPVWAAEPIEITDFPMTIGKGVQYLEDQAGQLTIEKVRAEPVVGDWQVSSDSRIALGISSSVYWFRTSLRLPAEVVDDDYFLEVSFPNLDYVDLYLDFGEGRYEHYRAGDQVDVKDKPYNARWILFPFSATANSEITLIFRVETTSAVELPMTLWPERQFVSHQQYRLAWIYCFYGVMLAMGVYHLLLFISTRVRTYLYFFFYAFCAALTEGHFDGVSQLILWQQIPYLNHLGFAFGLSGLLIGSTFFMSSLLQLDQSLGYPMRKKIITGLVAVGVIMFLLAVIEQMAWFTRISTVIYLLFALTFIVIGIQEWRAGNREAKYFVICWVGFLISTLLVVGTKLSLVDRSILTENALKVSILFGSLLMSYALAQKINMEKQLAHIAQTESKAKSVFLANLSHELMTPMNSIIGFSHRLNKSLDGRVSPRALDALGTITENAQKLQVIIYNLLDLSSLDSNEVEVNFTSVDLCYGLETFVDGYREEAERKAVSLSLILPKEKLRAKIDSVLFEKIVNKLLSNAVQYTDRGRIVVWLSLSNGVKPMIVLKVMDTGCGIAKAHLQCLFDSINRGSVEDGSVLGTGMGLSITKRCVEALNGDIRVRSQPGVGSEFIVSIPFISLDSDQHAQSNDTNCA